MRVAIIGAGLCGLSLAHKLKNQAQVTVFEKSRGVSGRMSTRYADPYRFDHGAQFFKARSQEFQKFLEPFIEKGVVQRWDARFVEFRHQKEVNRRQWGVHDPHYVAVPGMNALAGQLAQGLDVRLNTKVSRLERGSCWSLFDDQNQLQGQYDWVVLAIPAKQALDLAPDDFEHRAKLKDIVMKACFALMLGFEQDLNLDFDAAVLRDMDICWISVNSSKPGRSEAYSLLIHSTNAWADAHIDDDRQAVLEHLVSQAQRILGKGLDGAVHRDLHAWRYANVPKHKTPLICVDQAMRFATCGDWTIHGRVEAAYLSALRLDLF